MLRYSEVEISSVKGNNCRIYFWDMSKYKAIHKMKNADLKVVSATFLLVCFLSLNETTYQTKKDVFYFTSKALFVLEKIKF